MNWKIAGLSAVFLFLILAFPSISSAGSCAGTPCTINCTGGDCYGTGGDDSICGTKGDDTIYGYGGNDKICGGFGDDTLYGGDGNDILQGGWGEDSMYGDDGNDTLKGGQCDDPAIDGGAGASDTCEGGQGADILSNCELPIAGGDQGPTDPQTHTKCGD